MLQIVFYRKRNCKEGRVKNTMQNKLKILLNSSEKLSLTWGPLQSNIDTFNMLNVDRIILK